MGLSLKQVSNDGIEWSRALMQPQAQNLELSTLSNGRSQQQLNQQQYSAPLKCPRCYSTNTKFCYYNNYKKSQPRHFCKSCKRHWTKDGTLRNVPVGGGRKTKPLRTSKTTTTATSSSASTTTCTSSTTDGNISDRVNPCNVINQSHHGVFLGSTSSLPQNQELTFPCSNSGSSETSPSSISTSFHSSNLYSYSSEETTKDSIITTIMPATGNFTSTNHELWQVPNASRGTDMTSYWNWDDLDNFIASSDLEISYDYYEIKP